VVAAVTGRLTALVEHRRWATLARIRRLGGMALVATAAAGGLAGAWLGPPAMELVFGDGVRLEPGDSAVVAVGTVIAMANLVLTLGLLARNRSGGVVAAWLVAAPFGAAGHLLLGDSALSSTCWTFLVTEVAAFAALAGWESRSDRLVGREEHRGAERQVATGEDAGLDS
jgi:hypothetical protein